ncbi:4456_t:CDS:1 [Acaulospora morrowiae]|uniref:4456_t:CDS:1 n=1 Tax=Acaulospora morrowiae TaxID=94023 RepID=A0A9N9D0A1_9GLOM|nr:4456_t:CDS:1 [Acaulospora morrowiae]
MPRVSRSKSNRKKRENGYNVIYSTLEFVNKESNRRQRKITSLQKEVDRLNTVLEDMQKSIQAYERWYKESYGHTIIITEQIEIYIEECSRRIDSLVDNNEELRAQVENLKQEVLRIRQNCHNFELEQEVNALGHRVWQLNQALQSCRCNVFVPPPLTRNESEL